MSSAITLYSTWWCGYCRRLRRQLDHEGIRYVEVDIEADARAAAVVARINGGNHTVPTLVFEDGSALTNPSLAEVKDHITSVR
jgi:mycoredoxin